MGETMKRRLSNLEQVIRPPITAERFWALVEEEVKLRGVSEEEAFKIHVQELSDEELQYFIEITEPVASDSGGGPGYGTAPGAAEVSVPERPKV